MSASGVPADGLVDDFRDPEGRSRLETHWRLMTDSLRLKSRDGALPWHAYRAALVAKPDGQETRVPLMSASPPLG